QGVHPVRRDRRQERAQQEPERIGRAHQQGDEEVEGEVHAHGPQPGSDELPHPGQLSAVGSNSNESRICSIWSSLRPPSVFVVSSTTAVFPFDLSAIAQKRPVYVAPSPAPVNSNFISWA